MNVTPYRIDVPDAVLADLRARLARTRFPDAIEGSGWSAGTDLVYLRELVTYWQEQYDWRAVEARLNALPHFRAAVGGLGIHFVHIKGTGPAPLPLILSHGWPGSFLSFAKVLGPLTDPERHGGDPADAFDVVVPSLPGYGFSDRPRAPGMTVEKIADLWAELMGGLGYERFGAQGGDWGSIVTAMLAARHARRLVGIHLNMVVAGPPDASDPLAGVTEDEAAALAAVRQFVKDEGGYRRLQGTRPQTLGYALNDSPAGLAAWIVEKFRAWTDCDGDLERCYTKDEILTNIMLYWVTETATSSARLYYETRQTPPDLGKTFITVPTGCAMFPRELFRPPRAWVERQYNLQRWTPMPAGGHFAALEKPSALVDDIRAFFRPLRVVPP